jgi:hypothetical protein
MTTYKFLAEIELGEEEWLVSCPTMERYGGFAGGDTKEEAWSYLPNPYRFSEQQRRLLIPDLVRELEALGLEEWEPFARNNQVDFSKPGRAYVVGQADLRDVRESDATFAAVNGTPPDESVMVELGAAIFSHTL